MSEISISNQPRHVLEVDPSLVANPLEQKAVVAMQATALLGAVDFAAANDTLVETARELGVAPTMTYEDLVFVNPLEDGAYVLSTEPYVAEQEALFYHAHSKIEEGLGGVIEALQDGTYEPAADLLQVSAKSFGRLYRQLDPAAFAAFRPSFVGLNDHPGPSGLFTAAIPIIDLLSHGGSNITQDERNRILLDAERGLYPRHQSPLLRELILADEPQLDMPVQARERIVSLLDRFRSVHTGSVRRFAPEVLDTEAEGSGGIADVAAYLGSKLVTRSIK